LRGFEGLSRNYSIVSKHFSIPTIPSLLQIRNMSMVAAVVDDLRQA